MVKLKLRAIISSIIVNSVEVALEISKGQFVRWFKFAIIFMSLLDGIVGEVDVLVC